MQDVSGHMRAPSLPLSARRLDEHAIASLAWRAYRYICRGSLVSEESWQYHALLLIGCAVHYATIVWLVSDALAR